MTLGARPYIYGSANLGDNTHNGGADLNCRGHFTSKFYSKFGGGLSVHSGTNNIEFPSLVSQQGLTNDERIALLRPIIARFNNEIVFGSTVLFRAQIAIGYNINETWGADIVYEHLSNGGVFGGLDNDGLNNIGFRLSRKF
ncbi:MAG: acyloxyacyl hydrolase [Robiginitomaculum sp.]|nr:acyloxyacyl hydrolase [Robiginitomaculum sp.]